MQKETKYKKIWLGEVATDGRTLLEHINAVLKYVGFIPKNVFLEVEENDLKSIMGETK